MRFEPPKFGEPPDSRKSRASKIRALFDGGPIWSHTEKCIQAKLWTDAELSAALVRQLRSEVREALGAIDETGKPWAGPTSKRAEIENDNPTEQETADIPAKKRKKRTAPIWMQRNLWDLEDYAYNFNAYVKQRAQPMITVANALARECWERYGSGPNCVEIAEID
jgi:hypothetical protein